jgi:lipopolysaccharide biosynthesis glycosyltransferase
VSDDTTNVNVSRNQSARFKVNYLTLEAFRLKGYDRVVYLDSDMICLGDLSPIFERNIQTLAVTPNDTAAYRLHGDKMDLNKVKFNGGFLVIGPELLKTDHHYHKMVALGKKRSFPMAEQDLMNYYFGHSAKIMKLVLDHRWNGSKRHFSDSKFKKNFISNRDKIRIVHYVAAKPWHTRRQWENLFPDTPYESNYKKIDQVWMDEAAKHLIPDGTPPAHMVCTSEDLRSNLIAELDFHKRNDWRKNHKGFIDAAVALFREIGVDINSFNDKTVMDAGCGSKLRTSVLKGARLYGLDPLAESYMEEVPWCDLSLCEEVYSVGLETYLRQLNQRMDYIFCINVLDHTADWQKCINNLYCYLKPEGVLYLLLDIDRKNPDVLHNRISTKQLLEAVSEKFIVRHNSSSRGFDSGQKRLNLTLVKKDL